MEKILNDPKFQKTLDELAKKQGDSLEQITKEATTYLKELYTSQEPIANIIGIETTQYLLARAYDKTIDINPKEAKQVAKLMRKHPVAFVLTHKTYIDTLVLAVALARYGLPMPHTFAGINMSFMGIAQFGRKNGVIFIRRSFKDNFVYKATLKHYIASLVKDKAHFMWAIEGTRSRTGKLVWPKMGILKYIMDAEVDSAQEVKYVPVSIVYDLIPDVKEMTLEGRGKKKKAESLSWFVNYLRKMGDRLGKISLRFGAAVKPADRVTTPAFSIAETGTAYQGKIPRFALEIVHRINQITPVTTTSLICISLLSKYALTKRAMESDVADLMQLIESRKPDALVDRGKAIGESVQVAVNLLTKSGLVQQHGESLNSKYTINMEDYLPATYYSNMAVHHLYHRAFIELAFAKIADSKTKDKNLAFWSEIMLLRDIFKFEFFYSRKSAFTDEIESNLSVMSSDWQNIITARKKDIENFLANQKIFVAPALLYTYTEAYRVVAHALLTFNPHDKFEEKIFVETCLALGGEMCWQGRIQRIGSVSKPFLLNGIRLAKNRDLIPTINNRKEKEIEEFLSQLDDIAKRINKLQGITLSKPIDRLPSVPLERAIVPGAKTANITQAVFESESGAHIAAFFDLDRTLIKGFSAKEFFQTKLFSGKMTTKEVVAQFAGIIVYAMGNGNFAGLAALGAKGVKGTKEQDFIDVGEETYLKHLADAIYPESRALVAAHLAKGHTVAIISAATPYQVNPVARDLGIEHVMCTRMEVRNGKFTGEIIQPACWGEGKAYAAKELVKKYNLDLSKSYFYTDSAEDMPLLEIVGNPRPLNPDTKLSAAAFQNNWPIYRFDDEPRTGLSNLVRTALAAGSVVPAVMSGMAVGAFNMSWRDGINSMMAAVGDLGTAMAGITLSVKGEEHLWSHRPAVFIFNHQSSADILIASKLVRKNARGIAKKELQMTPILGQLMMAAGVIFLDRANREKAIEAMKPAVEALKKDTSIIIFPEGTRSKDYSLGKFKKGAFHLAMQAGVPLVPIVMKNAHDAMPKGSALFRPTLVEVVVLPPIPTKNWKVKDLNKHIAAVRAKFLKELGQQEKLNGIKN